MQERERDIGNYIFKILMDFHLLDEFLCIF